VRTAKKAIGTTVMTLSTFLEDVELAEGESIRQNCPECGGRNTFTVTRKLGKLVWNCYKASCGCSGAKRKNYSRDMIVSKLRDRDTKETTSCPFSIPEHFLNVLYTEHEEYLRSVHASNAETMLDTRENRVVFIIRDPDTREITGAVGRAMNKHKLPKWKRYDKTPDLLYFIGDGPTAVLVEDCASACAVANAGYTGIALLGTSIHDGHISQLMRFGHVIIALDKDASKKSIKLKKKLDSYMSSSVVLLPDDLKYFPPSEVQVILSA